MLGSNNRYCGNTFPGWILSQKAILLFNSYIHLWSLGRLFRRPGRSLVLTKECSDNQYVLIIGLYCNVISLWFLTGTWCLPIAVGDRLWSCHVISLNNSEFKPFILLYCWYLRRFSQVDIVWRPSSILYTHAHIHTHMYNMAKSKTVGDTGQLT